MEQAAHEWTFSRDIRDNQWRSLLCRYAQRRLCEGQGRALPHRRLRTRAGQQPRMSFPLPRIPLMFIAWTLAPGGQLRREWF